MCWKALFILLHPERYADEPLVSEFTLKFVYFQILFQFRTYIYYATNLCRIYRDKYLTVRKISTRLTQKIQIRTDGTWCWSLLFYKSSLTSELTPPSISVSSSERFGGVGSGLPRTRSHNKSRSFFLAGVAPSASIFFQLIILFRSATDHLSNLTWARWLARWYAASYPCTLVCSFCTYLLA